MPQDSRPPAPNKGIYCSQQQQPELVCTGHLSPGSHQAAQRWPGNTCTEHAALRGGSRARGPPPSSGQSAQPRSRGGSSVSTVVTAHPPLTCVPALLPKSQLDAFSEIETGSVWSGEGSPQVSKQSCQAQPSAQLRASSGEQMAVPPPTEPALVPAHGRWLLLHTRGALPGKTPAHSRSRRLGPWRGGSQRPTKPSGDRRPT